MSASFVGITSISIERFGEHGSAFPRTPQDPNSPAPSDETVRIGLLADGFLIANGPRHRSRPHLTLLSHLAALLRGRLVFGPRSRTGKGRLGVTSPFTKTCGPADAAYIGEWRRRFCLYC